MFQSSSIDDANDGLRKRIKNISFNNTTELNSRIYFCQTNTGDFNYSSNPTYLSNGEIVVKDGNRNNAALSYVTGVGLYSSDEVLLAVAKLSQPRRNDAESTLTFRVRIDY